MIEIRYVFHDCFVVKTPEYAMIFDYWKDPGDNDNNEGSPRFLEDLDPAKPLYVFVSHSHKDHFNRDIFSWAAGFPKIHYLVSRETARKCRYIMSPTSVYAGPKIHESQLSGMKAGEEWSDGTVNIRAFGSTDIGVSWMVEAGGKRIFHAGDYNAWLWRDESTPGEVKQAWNAYFSILQDITAYLAGRGIDYAFYPVDSRIGSDYWIGAKTFLEHIDVATFFPMHYGVGDEAEQSARRADAARISLYANPNRGKYVLLAAPGDTFAES